MSHLKVNRINDISLKLIMRHRLDHALEECARKEARGFTLGEKKKLENIRSTRRYLPKWKGFKIPGSHTVAEWEAKVAEFNGCCAYCGKKEQLTRDHVVAVTRGGSDNIDNIVPACKPCNSRKGNRW